MLIGITGFAGSGKDTIAEICCNLLSNCKIWHLADPLKHMCMDYLGLTYDDVYTRDGKIRYNEFWSMTNREILQKVGTDCFRNNFSKDFYCKLLELELKKNPDCNFIVPDIRFDNEAITIKNNNGIIIKTIRESHELSGIEMMHESEQGIDNVLIDYEINNSGSIEDLTKQLKNIINNYKNI